MYSARERGLWSSWVETRDRDVLRRCPEALPCWALSQGFESGVIGDVGGEVHEGGRIRRSVRHWGRWVADLTRTRGRREATAERRANAPLLKYRGGRNWDRRSASIRETGREVIIPSHRRGVR